MAPHSSTFAQKIPWTEEPGRLQFMGSLESDTTERLHFHFSLSCIGEGNGNPLQCSCLENPREGKPGWLPSMGSHSRTRLKPRSSSSSLPIQSGLPLPFASPCVYMQQGKSFRYHSRNSPCFEPSGTLCHFLHVRTMHLPMYLNHNILVPHHFAASHCTQ